MSTNLGLTTRSLLDGRSRRAVSGSHRLLSTVLLKALRDQFPTILAWIAGLVATIALYVSFYPSIRTDPSLVSLKTDAIPAGLSTAFGLDADLSVASAYLNATVFNLILPWLFIAYAVSNATRLIAGDEDRGLLELMLSLPIRRGRFVLDRFEALVIAIGGLALVAGLAIWAMCRIVDATVPVSQIAAAVASTALLGLSIGAATGRPSLALGGSLGFAIASYLANAVAKTVPSVDGLKGLSVFHAAFGNEPISNGFGWIGIVALLVVIGATTIVAVLSFTRRDIRS